MLWISVFILIFIRFSTIMMFMPMFNTRDIPMQAKVLLLAMISFIFFINGNYEVVENLTDAEVFLPAILFEFVNGFSVGMVVLLLTNAVYVTGQIVDMNIGFSIVSVISPTGEDQMPITSNFYYMLMVVIFMLGNFHHMVIQGFSAYLRSTAVGALSFNPGYVTTYSELIADTIKIGVAMALPMMLTILIADIVLGVLSKAMPGLNVFIIGMPFKIVVGLMTFVVVFPIILEGIDSLLSKLMGYIYFIIGIG